MLIILSGALAFIFILAFLGTINKTEIEFNIHINKEVVYQSAYGESPTFAIWIEELNTGATQTIYVTNRAASNDWAGKSEVPVALPKWFELDAKQKSDNKVQNQEQLIISGATPKPGYFRTRVKVRPGSNWNCWIEVNLAGDYNDTYKEFDSENMTTDEYALGQPALLYKSRIIADIGYTITPEIEGMVLIDSTNEVVVKPLKGITTAKDIFDEIVIRVVKPKPKLIK